MRRTAALFALLILAAPAGAMVRVPSDLGPIAGNPANKLAGTPIEGFVYDPARRCTPKQRRPGVQAFTAWLQRNAGGVAWNSYRCEKWGKGRASLHAEGRALDWHLNRGNATDAREAERLILLLLAPDTAGYPHALARRMGIQEIIWDCGYWRSQMADFAPYGACLTKRGKPKKRVGVTVAHRDHIHFGFTKAGAARSTSFWSRR